MSQSLAINVGKRDMIKIEKWRVITMTTKRRRLTAKTKFEIYIKTRDESNVGEVLREYGIHLSDLREIEELVEAGAVDRLKTKGAKTKVLEEVSFEEYQELAKELDRKEKALADLTVEYLILKKNDK